MNKNMVQALVALCIIAAVQVSSSYQVAVPVFKQPYERDVTTHIVGGQTASRGQFPHQAGITADGKELFGGSLISKNWVLTSANCVYEFSQWKVVLGAQNITDANEPGRFTVESGEAVAHENYDPESVHDDIGVIKLPTDVPLSNLINIIALPPRSWKDVDFTGTQVRISGWGRTSDRSKSMSPTLQFVDLPLISLTVCQRLYPITGNTLYCASAENAKSSCDGDNGGSVTIGSGQNLTNLAVVSFYADNVCSLGFPVGFTATPHYVDWISTKTGIPVRDF